MMRRLLVLGMLAGLLASLAAFGFASLAAEPQVDAAIAIEEAAGGHSHAAHDHGDRGESAGHGAGGADESDGGAITRGVQKGIGLASALGLYGTAMGGLFAIACAFAYGRIGPARMRGTAAAVALAGFTVVALVPFLKYPANPPAVGSEDTIDRRTGLYVAMLAVTALAAVLAAWAGRFLALRTERWNAAAAGFLVFCALVATAAVAMPPVNEVPADFPAELLWRFRLSSLGTQAILWAVLGAVFGPLAQRVLTPADAPRAAGRAGGAAGRGVPAAPPPG